MSFLSHPHPAQQPHGPYIAGIYRAKYSIFAKRDEEVFEHRSQSFGRISSPLTLGGQCDSPRALRGLGFGQPETALADQSAGGEEDDSNVSPRSICARVSRFQVADVQPNAV